MEIILWVVVGAVAEAVFGFVGKVIAWLKSSVA